MHTTRRSFLKIGLIGGLTLAAGGALYRMVQGTAPLRPFALDEQARKVLGAIIPVMLGPVLPAGEAARAAAAAATAERVQGAVRGLPLATQKEVQDLFGLLSLGPARRFLAGLPASWDEASDEQVQAFLHSWRFHRIAMLVTAYQALHDLIAGAWYSDPAHWEAIGYPGPIKELS